MKSGSKAWICWCILLSVWPRSESLNNSCSTFYLLNLYPAPDESSFTGYDGGFELIPAGHLATQHINSDSSVLPGHRIELIDVPTEACERTLIIEGLTNYHKQALNPDGVCIYGIVGLYCSEVTDVIAPIANHNNTGYVQLAASTSPVHENAMEFPYTFHIRSSTRVLNEAAVEVMDKLNWTKVTTIFDPLSVFHRSTVRNFMNLLGDNATVRTIPMVPFLPTSDIFTQLQTRIIYITASDIGIVEFFCEASKKKFLWPSYVYIIVEKSYEELLRTPSKCSVETLTKALEGTFLLQYKLHIDRNSEIDVLGRTYTDYYDEYSSKLQEFAGETKTNLNPDENAVLLYDQVWAFALALNTSLGDVNILNDTISRGNLKDRKAVRKTLANNMKHREFTGASGTVKFGKENEVSTPVTIYQILNGKKVLIGTYDSFLKIIMFNSSYDKDNLPEDTFETRLHRAPLWVGTLVIIASVAILLLILFNTVVTILLKNKPEIKSGSFSLSLVILLGSCISSISPIFATVLATETITNTLIATSVCNIDLWTFFIGIIVIFAALFVRLLRVYNIFQPYNHTGKYLSDKYLLLYITLISSIIIAILILWAVVDPFKYSSEVFKVEFEPPPYFLVVHTCSSKHLGIWLAVSFSFIACITLLLVFFAVQTRHVKIKDFKDTKKVNMFLFSVCISYAIFLPLWLILSELGFPFFTAAYVCKSIAILAGAALCQVFLLLPKTIPAVFKSRKKNETLTALVHYVQQNL